MVTHQSQYCMNTEQGQIPITIYRANPRMGQSNHNKHMVLTINWCISGTMVDGPTTVVSSRWVVPIYLIFKVCHPAMHGALRQTNSSFNPSQKLTSNCLLPSVIYLVLRVSRNLTWNRSQFIPSKPLLIIE